MSRYGVRTWCPSISRPSRISEPPSRQLVVGKPPSCMLVVETSRLGLHPLQLAPPDNELHHHVHPPLPYASTIVLSKINKFGSYLISQSTLDVSHFSKEKPNKVNLSGRKIPFSNQKSKRKGFNTLRIEIQKWKRRVPRSSRHPLNFNIQEWPQGFMTLRTPIVITNDSSWPPITFPNRKN